MELRAETSVFDDKLLKENIDNAQETADNAQVIAGTTAQYFWFLEEISGVPAGVGTGAHITNLTKEEFLNNPANGGGNLLARSNGIAIRDGLTELASFGTFMQIGESGKSHVYVDYHSMQLIDKESSIYFHVSDLRDLTGIATLTETFYGDGRNKTYPLSLYDGHQITSVTVNGTAVAYTVDNTGKVTLNSFPAAGATIAITYKTASSKAKVFTFGDRANGTVGSMSFSVGASNRAGGYCSASFGTNNQASAKTAFVSGESSVARGICSRAGGSECVASGDYSVAEGIGNSAYGYGSQAFGVGTTADGEWQTVIGLNNFPYTDCLFIIGNGVNEKSNAFEVTLDGNVYVNGTQVHSSDRRLKEHISYLGDEAVDFINGLKPVHYTKNGESHVGFYAQDVEEVDKWDCMIGEMNGYMTLGYMELIAPLVAYVQRLEERIAELEKRLL